MITRANQSTRWSARAISRLIAETLDCYAIDGSARWDILGRDRGLTLLVEADSSPLVVKLVDAERVKFANFEATTEAQAWLADEALSPGVRTTSERARVATLDGPPKALASVQEFRRGSTIETLDPVTLSAVGRLAGRIGEALNSFVSSTGRGDAFNRSEDRLDEAEQRARSAGEFSDFALRMLGRIRAVVDRLPRVELELVHGDLHLGNVLRTNDGYIAVDLDDVSWGIPHSDLATLCALPDATLHAPAIHKMTSAYWTERSALEPPKLSRHLLGVVCARLLWTAAHDAHGHEPGLLARQSMLIVRSVEALEQGVTLTEWTRQLSP